MTDVVVEAVEALRDAGARLEPGLSGAELAALQAKWGIALSGDHAELLQLGVPVGQGWVDWRADPDEVIRARLQAPVEGLLFDVVHHHFWPASWGVRPDDPGAAEERAALALATWPRLIPLYGHRYLPPGLIASPSPVLSVVQSDVVFYGRDLLAWVQREFLGVPLPEQPVCPDLPNWAKLAAGCADADL